MEIDKLVKAYVNCRDDLKAVTKKNKADMAYLEKEILKLCEEQNVESFVTKYGTAYRKKTEFFSIENWGAALDFIIAEDLTHILPKSLKAASLKEYREENDRLPPGVTPGTRINIGIRRK